MKEETMTRDEVKKTLLNSGKGASQVAQLLFRWKPDFETVDGEQVMSKKQFHDRFKRLRTFPRNGKSPKEEPFADKLGALPTFSFESFDNIEKALMIRAAKKKGVRVNEIVVMLAKERLRDILEEIDILTD